MPNTNIGLTSCSRLYDLQVHKGSTQTNKRLKLGFKYKGAKKPSVLWSGAPDSVRCTRSVQRWTSHSRFPPGALRYNSPDCLVWQWINNYFAQQSTAKARWSDEQWRTMRAESEPQVRGTPDTEQCLSSATPDCPVPLEDKASNGQKLQNPKGWVTWLAYRTMSGGAPDCPVRLSTAAYPNGYLVVESYKYPQPPPVHASKISEYHIRYWKSPRGGVNTQIWNL
jgi:hypothetical protein